MNFVFLETIIETNKQKVERKVEKYKCVYFKI